MTCQLYVINAMPVLPLVLQFDLVQFLIQNGLKIFREDITSLCVQSPMTGENSKKSAFTSKDEMGSGGKQTLSVPGGEGNAQMML